MTTAKKDTVRFSRGTTRCASGYEYAVLPNGRHAVIATEGVYARCGFVVTGLGRSLLGFTNESGAEWYRSYRNDPSFQASDMPAVWRQLLRVDVVKRVGKGRNAHYMLTAKGREIWRHSINKEWIGQRFDTAAAA